MANSSLFMINVEVNAKYIKYNQNTNEYTAEYVENPPPKIMCFNDCALSCAQSNKNKHLILKQGTIVLAIPPGVSMSAHHAHNLSLGKWTIVFTSRGLSIQKKNSQSLSKLIESFNSKLSL